MYLLERFTVKMNKVKGICQMEETAADTPGLKQKL